MDPSRQLLADVTMHAKYLRYRPDLGRKETFIEAIDRLRQMHLVKYRDRWTDELDAGLEDALEAVERRDVLPSMRSVQFAAPGMRNEVCIYNCSYAPIDDQAIFGEAAYLLLSGSGFGFSVQHHHVARLPALRLPTESAVHAIGDSREGWADAFRALFRAYLLPGEPDPNFDASLVRPKGAIIRSIQEKAPGPEPLLRALLAIRTLLRRAAEGGRASLPRRAAGSFLRWTAGWLPARKARRFMLGAAERLDPRLVTEDGRGTPLLWYDCVCLMSDCVLAGGIRRSAMICLFSPDDAAMLAAKSGEWWETHPWRARSNNSAMLRRGRTEAARGQFQSLWKTLSKERTGEPGVYFTNDDELEWGTNPCGETGLRPHQFCNLSEINAATVASQRDLERRARQAAFLGTLQAGYTDFDPTQLRPCWRETTERDALLGVSMTGIAEGALEGLDVAAAARVAVSENARIARLLGINAAARVTAIKPAGTTSLVLGTSSGVHSHHAPYYVRNMRLNREEALARYLIQCLPELVEPESGNAQNTNVVLSVPQRVSSPTAVFRDEGAFSFLERVSRYHREWILPGHRDGVNTHSVSATVSVRDGEWVDVGAWLWKHRDAYNGIACFPMTETEYPQKPFEDCDAAIFEELHRHLKELDLSKVDEKGARDEPFPMTVEPACGGGNCEITQLV